ncbi:spore cortex biosynthesis protein YabQ [Thermaerobacter subterraneus]|uniref:Spore cortex protein, YabQ family n=1 Tax=Thermaerobacter subterraneus DSM 13965 TaxID=867903 RepID=K6P0T8_9FIRM|nr:spore cortex biosynthesis protein YabQ [Thermaerobacter subterraneus]EKP94715.1 spore cortex protein, YabQ family [Thermaerobacter subterraneus DSM 13965]
MFPLTVQLYMLAVNVALGLTLGFLFDACRALRAVLGGGRPPRRPWLDALLDGAFWALALPLVLLAWGWGNWGQVRTFTFLGLALGLGVYAGLGSPFLYPALAATYRATSQGTLRFIRWNRRAAGALGRGCRWVVRSLALLVRWLLKPVTIPLGWLLAPVSIPVQRHFIDPCRAALRRHLLDPWRRYRAAAGRRLSGQWNRLRAVLAALIGPHQGAPPPPPAG